MKCCIRIALVLFMSLTLISYFAFPENSQAEHSGGGTGGHHQGGTGGHHQGGTGGHHQGGTGGHGYGHHGGTGGHGYGHHGGTGGHGYGHHGGGHGHGYGHHGWYGHHHYGWRGYHGGYYYYGGWAYRDRFLYDSFWVDVPSVVIGVPFFWAAQGVFILPQENGSYRYGPAVDGPWTDRQASDDNPD